MAPSTRTLACFLLLGAAAAAPSPTEQEEACAAGGNATCEDQTALLQTAIARDGWQPHSQCQQLSGTFCGGTDLQCNCNYCDDFRQNSRCANACRVMNGYSSSPIFGTFWTPSRTPPWHVESPQGCNCDWMKGKGGLKDDCKQCDACAYKCRKANPGPCSGPSTTPPPTPQPPRPSCVRLSGTFCGGNDLQCDCNYCDDFRQNSRCANACRVMNGYRSSPISGVYWTARRAPSWHVESPQGCNCDWMKENGGSKDDCKQCDTCAYKCRKANPQGPCRG